MMTSFNIGSTVRLTNPLWGVNKRTIGRVGIVTGVSKYGDVVEVKFEGNKTASRLYVKSLSLVKDKNQIQTPGYYGC